MPTAADFRMEMYRMMYEAMQEGETTAEINSGELHTRVGGYLTNLVQAGLISKKDVVRLEVVAESAATAAK